MASVSPRKHASEKGRNISRSQRFGRNSAGIADPGRLRLGAMPSATIMVTDATREELKLEIVTHKFAPWPLLVLANHEHWHQKVRVVAIVVKVILKLRDRVREKKHISTPLKQKEKGKGSRKFVIHLSANEREKAEYLLVSAIQATHFEKEIIQLLKLGILTPNTMKEIRNSKLSSLSPFIDPHNVVRAGGRYGRANYLPYSMRFPIILPSHQDENVRSLIRHYHVDANRGMHLTKVQTYYHLRQKYYLLGGKTAVSYTLNRCILCQRMTKRVCKQTEGDLPSSRLELVPPFQNSGIDIAGPFHVKHGRGTSKRWLMLVCCMVTRAVGLYPIRDMTTSAVINALIRMNSHFPSLQNLFSDQGTNFKGADREIHEELKAWDKNQVSTELEKQGLTWTFGPADCGSAGGAWERLIGMTKKLIRSVVGTENLDNDEFETVIAGSMGIMNRRPLVRASADMNDPMVLSPCHFLYPYLFTNSATSIVPPLPDQTARLQKGWKNSQILLDRFWNEFQTEYVTKFLRRNGSQEYEKLRVGDVVIVSDSQQPREYWKFAVIKETLNNEETRPRIVKLQDARGKTFSRHANSIVRLELSD